MGTQQRTSQYCAHHCVSPEATKSKRLNMYTTRASTYVKTELNEWCTLVHWWLKIDVNLIHWSYSCRYVLSDAPRQRMMQEVPCRKTSDTMSKGTRWSWTNVKGTFDEAEMNRPITAAEVTLLINKKKKKYIHSWQMCLGKPLLPIVD